jgi:enterochelin esterase family protein
MRHLTGLLAAAALLVAGSLSAQEIQNFQRTNTIVSPEVTETTVTFRLRAPQAKDVRVLPSWLGYGPDAQEAGKMTKGADGVWTKTFDRPSSELYTYTFSVDGVSALDPSNVFVQRDGTRFMNALILDGGLGDLYKECEEAGNLEHVWYWSGTPGMYRRMYVYTPFGYDPNDKMRKYPVLYLLHGGGGDEDAWSTLGRTCQILDNLIARGEAVPMLVVMANGNPTQHAARTLMIPEAKVAPSRGSGRYDNYASMAADIVPYIDSHYNVIQDREGRAIAGLSMGGGHSVSISRQYPNVFDYVGVFSAGGRIHELDEKDPANKLIMDQTRTQIANGVKQYWIGVGRDDMLYSIATTYYEDLKALGMPNLTLRESEGAHVWNCWRLYLSEFAPLLFKK